MAVAIAIATNHVILAVVIISIPLLLVSMKHSLSIFDKSISELSEANDKLYEYLSANKFDKKSAENKGSSGFLGGLRPYIYNTPIPYHLMLVVLAIISLVFYDNDDSIINKAFYLSFVDDFWFQLASSVLFIILGLFNPFAEASEDTKNKAENLRKKMQKSMKKKLKSKEIDVSEEMGDQIMNYQKYLYDFVMGTKKIFSFKMLICLFAIGLFLYKGWLVFPPLKPEHPLLIGITITILLFIFRNVYMLQQHPRIFLGENFFRLYKLIALVKASLFIIVPLILVSLALFYLLGMEVDISNYNLTPTLFIGFNIAAAYLEFALIKSLIK